MKKCSTCKRLKELEKFSKDATKKSGICSTCKECNKLAGLNFKLRSYKISLDDLEELLVKQDSSCAICKKKLDKFHIDHDHQTMKVRGLLCGKCNRGIGLLQDSKEILQRAIDYLSR